MINIKNCDRSSSGFLQTLKLKHDHAFGMYFAALCYKKMNLLDKFETYYSEYKEIVQGSDFWKIYVERFNLAALQ